MQKVELDKAIELVIDTMQEIGMDAKGFIQCDPKTKAIVFPLEEMEYYAGIKLYRGVLEKLGIHKDVSEVYEEFDKVYEVCARKETKQQNPKR